MNNSLVRDIKKLERYILNLPKAKSLNTINRIEREAMMDLRDTVSYSRESIVNYVASDSTLDKLKFLENSIEQLSAFNDRMLLASQYDLLDAVDVAHLSAISETIKERLR